MAKTPRPFQQLAFIWSIYDKCYLGISLESNADGEFCTSVGARLDRYTPHAFDTVAQAETCLKQDTPWYNSGPNQPQRGKYSMNNCIIVVVDLPKPEKGVDLPKERKATA
jgi:hypothetical protein